MEVEEIDEDEPEVLEVDVPAAANDPADDDAEVLEVEVPAGTSQMEVEGLDDVDVPVAASDDGAGAQAAQLLADDRGAAIRLAHAVLLQLEAPELALLDLKGLESAAKQRAKDAEAEAKRLEREEAKAAKRAAKQAEEEERQRQKLAQQEEKQQKRVEAAAEKRKTKQESTPASDAQRERWQLAATKRGFGIGTRVEAPLYGGGDTGQYEGSWYAAAQFAAQFAARNSRRAILLNAHHTSLQVRGGGARRHRLAEARLQSAAHFRHLRRSPRLCAARRVSGAVAGGG